MMKLSFAVLAILVIFNTAHATGYGGDTYNQTSITYHLDDDAIHSVMAGAMAADAISFSAHTRKKQFGIGLGHYRGENSLALGFGQLIETENYEILLSLKGAYIEHDEEVAVGVGATVEVD